MLRIIQTGNSLPMSFILDPSAEFQAGQVAQLTVIGNQVMATVSNGTAPIGIIDDIRTRAFTNVSWNEVIIVPSTGVMSGGRLVSPIDLKAELKRPNIVSSTFTSDVSVILNPVNGIITFPAGTALNFDLLGTGDFNAIRTVVNYTYQVPNIPGDDSTMGSKRVTVWFDRMFFQTDQYETNVQYPVCANLYVSEAGFLTTRRVSDKHPSIGMVTAPPTTMNPLVEALFF